MCCEYLISYLPLSIMRPSIVDPPIIHTLSLSHTHNTALNPTPYTRHNHHVLAASHRCTRDLCSETRSLSFLLSSHKCVMTRRIIIAHKTKRPIPSLSGHRLRIVTHTTLAHLAPCLRHLCVSSSCLSVLRQAFHTLPQPSSTNHHPKP